MAFISEVNFRGGGTASGEFVEITLTPSDDPNDFTVSVYRNDGTLHTAAGIPGGEVNLGTLTGTPHPSDPTYTVYVIDVGIKNGNSDNNEGSGVALTDIENDVTISFYSADNIAAFTATAGAANGELSESILEHTDTEPGESYQWDQDGNLTFGTITSGSSVICLSGNGQVLTRHGRTAARRLKAGDLVWTADHGYQPIRWIGKTRVSAQMMAENPKLRPVRLVKGSLAPDMPSSNMLVSRQHRVMVSSPVAKPIFGQPDVLVAAHQLCAFNGIEERALERAIVYVHILFDRHEVVDCDGALVESLLMTTYSSSMARRVAVTSGKVRNIAAHQPLPARPLAEGRQARTFLAKLKATGRSAGDTAAGPGAAARAASGRASLAPIAMNEKCPAEPAGHFLIQVTA